MIPVPALRRLRRAYWLLMRALWRWRRARLLAQVRLAALLRHARVELDVAPDVVLGRRIHVDILPGSVNRLRLGSGSRIQEDVLLWFRGGTLTVERGSVLRRGVRLDTSGALTIGVDVVVSFGAALHCAESLVIDDHAMVAEYVTLTDSFHEHEPGRPILDVVRARPTRIGRNAWVCAGAVIGAGVEVGDAAVVAGHAMVTTDVEPGWVVAGVPARPVRRSGGLVDES